MQILRLVVKNCRHEPQIPALQAQNLGKDTHLKTLVLLQGSSAYKDGTAEYRCLKIKRQQHYTALIENVFDHFVSCLVFLTKKKRNYDRRIPSPINYPCGKESLGYLSPGCAINKAGYTANTSRGRVGRGGNARFPTFRPVLTDRQTDGQTNGWTKPLIELRVRN